jgi:hypothetical protein
MGKEPVMNKCLTKPFMFRKGSGCLVEKPECSFANKFGFSFVCRHADHVKFHAHAVGALTEDEASELYDTLRQKRRYAFIASLDEESRIFFCLIEEEKTAFEALEH